MATTNAIGTSNPIQVAKGGTGAATLTGILVGNGTSAVGASTVTQYGTVIAGASNTVSSIAPSATSGVPLISQGAASNPAYGTVVVAGGGTGATTLTVHGLLIGQATSAVTAMAAGNAGQIVTSSGAADPVWTTATYPATAATGSVLYASGTNTIAALAAGTQNYVLTMGASVPAWAAAAGGGITTLNGDSGSATGATVTIAGSANQIVTSGSGATMTLALTSAVTIAGAFTTTNGDHIVGNTAAATTAPFITFKKSRSAGVITSGDVLGEIDFTGIGATTVYVTGASIRSVSSGTIASTRVASNLIFATHPDSTTGVTDRMTIASTGAVTIAAPDSGTGLTVSGGGIAATGSVTATTTMTASSGNITITSGDLALTSGRVMLGKCTSTTVGVLYGANVLNSTATNPLPVLHTYGDTGGTAGNNIFVGQGSGNFSLSQGTAIGNTALSGYTGEDGTNRVKGALSALTSGAYNTAIGGAAGYAITTGSWNAMHGLLTARRLTTGANNTIIGACYDGTIAGVYGAGYQYTGAESSNVLLASPGVTGESNVIRIGVSGGTAGKQNKAYLVGVYGVTIGATTGAMLVDTNDQLGTVISSAKFKENIVDMGESSSPLMKLRPVNFNYKKRMPNIHYDSTIQEDPERPQDNPREIEVSDEKVAQKQWGLIAEEVADIFPDVVNYDKSGEPFSIRYHELPVLLLNEIQKLNARIAALEARSTALAGGALL